MQPGEKREKNQGSKQGRVDNGTCGLNASGEALQVASFREC